MKRILSLLLCFCMVFSLCVTVHAADSTVARTSPEEILSQMSLEEKIAQMLIPVVRTWNGENLTEINDDISAAIETYGFGGVILFAENAKGTAAATRLIYDLQDAAKIPMLTTVDQEGGYVTRLGTGTTTAGNMALGAAGDPAYARMTAEIIGAELAAEGFNVDFAPDMDVNNNPANPVIGVRSFSDDPAMTAELGTAFLRGLQSRHVAAALKHFPGHGDTAVDSHTGLPCIDKNLQELESFELIPFQAGIDAGADMIMTAHIQYPQIEKETYISKADGEKITLPATLSKTIITGILREKMGFTGVVTTDGMDMDAIAQHFDRFDAARLAINAGVDMLLGPVSLTSPDAIADCGNYIQTLSRMVRNGDISEDTIDAAVTRILTMKQNRGILSYAPADKETAVVNALRVVGSKENHEKEWEIAKKAITLVKNDAMLPLDLASHKNIVLFCSYSNEVNSMQYAISLLQKEGRLPADINTAVICYNNRTELTEEDIAAVQRADTVIASVESYRAANITGGWQASFLDALIAQTHKNGKQIAIISIQLPYDVARYQNADAILAAYSCKGMNSIPQEYTGETATYGPNLSAAVYTVLGGSNPTGKLPVSIPKLNAEYSYSGDTLYPRGYGLTFSSGDPTGLPYKDVPAGAYYYDAVVWASQTGVVKGTSPTAFTPKGVCTRGQIVTMLHRMYGEPAAAASNPFADVKPGSYCENAVAWASENGIVTGYSSDCFGPNDPISREQLAVMLYRYQKFIGRDVRSDTDLRSFADAGSISSWATEAIRWAVGAGILKGDITFHCLLPGAWATRAETVTMLYRFSN